VRTIRHTLLGLFLAALLAAGAASPAGAIKAPANHPPTTQAPPADVGVAVRVLRQEVAVNGCLGTATYGTIDLWGKAAGAVVFEEHWPSWNCHGFTEVAGTSRDDDLANPRTGTSNLIQGGRKGAYGNTAVVLPGNLTFARLTVYTGHGFWPDFAQQQLLPF
jgi:hypothetical protein